MRALSNSSDETFVSATIEDISEYDSNALIKTGEVYLDILVRDVALKDNYALIAAYEGDLKVFDISDPVSAFIVTNYSVPGYSVGISVSGNLGFISYEDGIEIINISTLPTIVHLSYFNIASGRVRRVFVEDNYAYLSCGYGGVVVLNITDPTNPEQIGNF